VALKENSGNCAQGTGKIGKVASGAGVRQWRARREIFNRFDIKVMSYSKVAHLDVQLSVSSVITKLGDTMVIII
jgi:hypothetical protein